MNSLLDAQTSVCLLLDELRLPRLGNKLAADSTTQSATKLAGGFLRFYFL